MPSPTFRPSRVAATLLGIALVVQAPPPRSADAGPTLPSASSAARATVAAKTPGAVLGPAAIGAAEVSLAQQPGAYDPSSDRATVTVSVAPLGFDATWQYAVAVRGSVVRSGTASGGGVTVEVSNRCAIRSQSVTVSVTDATGHVASDAAILDRSPCPPLAVAPHQRERILARPTLGEASFVDRLRATGSPTLRKGGKIYRTFLKHGVNPAFALGMFHAESTSGTRGYAVITRNWGNLLYYSWLRRYGAVPYKPGNGYTYANFPSWGAGVRACAALLRRYDRAGYRTVSTASARWLGTRVGSKRHVRYLTNIVEAMALLPDDARPSITALDVPRRHRSPVVVRWSAADNIGAVAYRIKVKRAGGDWRSPRTTTKRSASLDLKPGTWVVAVRAFDASGNGSAWRKDTVRVR
jgi:hypothetical protein